MALSLPVAFSFRDNQKGMSSKCESWFLVQEGMPESLPTPS